MPAGTEGVVAALQGPKGSVTVRVADERIAEAPLAHVERAPGFQLQDPLAEHDAKKNTPEIDVDNGAEVHHRENKPEGDGPAARRAGSWFPRPRRTRFPEGKSKPAAVLGRTERMRIRAVYGSDSAGNEFVRSYLRRRDNMRWYGKVEWTPRR